MRKQNNHSIIANLLLVLGAALPVMAAEQADKLDLGFKSPPPEAKLRAYWWWLNGNVSKQSITRDLEQMADKGFGGALICDASGANQDGNANVPHGPTFFTPEWRELYKHALREADRLGLEMSLNIQSGWNLGGPMVKPEEAPKRLTWSEARVIGPGAVERKLAEPEHPREFYRDLFVLAYPIKANAAQQGDTPRLQARSAQSAQAVGNAFDGRTDTFWVSGGTKPGDGPTQDRPEWIQLNFASATQFSGLVIQGRPNYGPKSGELQISDDGKDWRRVQAFTSTDGRDIALKLDKPVTASHARAVFFSSFDPHHTDSPRNVQVSEIKLIGADPAWNSAGTRAEIQRWKEKALLKPMGSSAPDTSFMLTDVPGTPGEEDTLARDVVDITEKMAANGTLKWDVPAGEWQVIRFGCTLNQHCRVSTCSEGWDGYALDAFDTEAFRTYWDAVVEPLIADAGPLAGRALKYLHTDSWEIEVANWTPTLREEFRARRGYDLLGYLPALTGRIVDSREVTNRFYNDFRKTMGDLAIDNHYKLFSQWAAKHNLLLHPESGGPHAVPVDSLRCLGMDDAPMSEFWARSWRHRVADETRFFVKQPASAAHTYGRRLVLAEGFTTIGPHWQETPADNLKPSFDRACCEGLNRLVWHAFTCSPDEMGLPGQEYFAGTHFNPQATWWSRSGPFLAYINRCQWMLQQGLFVADAVYYYGDHVPNFTQLRASDPAKVGAGYDYDVATEEVVLTRMNVRDGRIVLPDGMSYRVLALPDRPAISLPVLRKLKELIEAGATVIGPKPTSATTLQGYPACDDEVKRIADELWGDGQGERRVGMGRVICGKTARQVLEADRVSADVDVVGVAASQPVAREQAMDAVLNYIHRRDGKTEIYFVCNRTGGEVNADVRFRVTGKRPELWNPLSGETRPLPEYRAIDGRTVMPLQFAPYGSWFVVFRKPEANMKQSPTPSEAEGMGHPAAESRNFPALAKVTELSGPWTVQFDPKWGGPESVGFDSLVDWTKRPEDGIRFYSGTATYKKTFDCPGLPDLGGGHSARLSSESADKRIWLDLGKVRQIAEVRLNGKNLGVLWALPLRVDVTGVLKEKGNELEIDVVNFWPNRVIGDQSLPPEQRRTNTNIRKLTKDMPLVESGLLGPVTVLVTEEN